MNYFVSNTKNTLVPLCLDQDYCKELGGFAQVCAPWPCPRIVWLKGSAMHVVRC